MAIIFLLIVGLVFYDIVSKQNMEEKHFHEKIRLQSIIRDLSEQLDRK